MVVSDEKHQCSFTFVRAKYRNRRFLYDENHHQYTILFRTSNTNIRIHTRQGVGLFAHLNSIKSPALVLVPHTVGFLPTCVTLSSPGLVIDDGDAGAVLSSAACCFFRLSASAFLSACENTSGRPACCWRLMQALFMGVE